MEMVFHLDSDIFEIVEQGIKDLEVRANDEKRRKLKIGDTLIFLKRPEEKESIKAKVTNLEYFNTLEEVVNNYEMDRIITKDYNKESYIELMKRFYSDEEIDNYGIVVISFDINLN